MRLIVLFAIGVWVAACTTPSVFPPEIMKGVEINTFDVNAWKNQASSLSSANPVAHKVELGGQIIRIIQKSDGVVLLVMEEPFTKYRVYGPVSTEPVDSFIYAIAFKGFPEATMLRTGNKLVVVGTTDKASTEILAGVPTVLPHLNAQCLHIWEINQAELQRFPYGDMPSKAVRAEETFCDEG